MLKKLLLCIFAMAQLLCANMKVNYTVSVGGRELPGTFSGKQLHRCAVVSAAAVEEITRGTEAPAEYSARARLTFLPTEGDMRTLNDALITDAPGVMRCCAVYACGEYAGTVSDPEILENSLHNYWNGIQDGRLVLRPVYGYIGEYHDDAVTAIAEYKLT